MNKFSVLMAVYFQDNPIYLKQALISIWDDQFLKPNEIVIVKDGPLTLDLDKIISDFIDSKPVNIITLPKNVGLGKALNIGLKECKNELVARMDSDDIAVKDRFKIQIEFFKEHIDASIVGGAIEEFNDNPGDLGNVRFGAPIQQHKLRSFAKKRNPLNHVTVMFKKKDILSVGSYQHMLLFEDYYLWIRMILKGYKIYNISEILLYVRIGNDMIGRRHGISYLKKELNFFRSIMRLGYINKIEYILTMIYRIPIRIMPKRILEFFYQRFLR